MEEAIWRSEDDKKPPKGFEKFFKKKEDREKEASPTSEKGRWPDQFSLSYKQN